MFNKEDKKSCHHGILALIITLLLGFILIVLVFKTGMMVGSKSHFSSCKLGNYQQNLSGHMGGKFIDWKKSEYLEDYEAKAEAMGMTLEEYKEYLVEQKKLKTE